MESIIIKFEPAENGYIISLELPVNVQIKDIIGVLDTTSEAILKKLNSSVNKSTFEKLGESIKIKDLK